MPQHLDTTTAKEIARLNGVTLSAVTNWKAEGCPHVVDTRGRVLYVPADVTNWRLDRASRSAPSELDKEAEQVRKLKAEADRVELEVAKVRGELVPMSTFETALAKACSRMRGVLLKMPSMHADAVSEQTGCDMATAQSLLAGIADEALTELAQGGDDAQ